MFLDPSADERVGIRYKLVGGGGADGSRRFRLQDFHDIRHMKVLRLSASRTGRLYPQEMFLVLIFDRG